MNWSDTTLIAGIIQAAGTLGAGGIAGFVAWKALDSWRDQELGRRAIGYSEECLLAADEVVAFIAVARNRGFRVYPKDGDDSAEAVRRLVFEKQFEAMESARVALVRCRSLVRRIALITGDNHAVVVDRLEKPLWHLLQLLYLIQELGTPISDDHEGRRQLVDARSDFLGFSRLVPGQPIKLPSEHPDPIQKDILAAHQALEAALRPILRGRRGRGAN